MRAFPVLLLVCAALAAPVQPSRRGVTPADYLALRNVTDARISPDGMKIAYVVTSVDEKRNRRTSEIWMVDTADAHSGAQFTTAGSSRSPRWSPDGKSLAYLAARGTAKPQVRLLSMAGGEARQVTDLADGVEAFEWSPGGDRLVCISRTGPPVRSVDQGGSDVRHYLFSNYKFNDSGFYDTRRGHLFVVDVASGKARQITSGDQRNDADPQWSPDGTKIAFAAERTDASLMESGDVYVVAAEGGEPLRINPKSGNVRLARWSPDGARIAYAAAPTAEEELKIWIAPASGGASRLAGREVDLAPTAMSWQSDHELYFEAPSKGEDRVFRIDPASGAVTAVTSGARSVHLAQWNRKAGVMAYLANDFKHPDDLFAANLSAGAEKRLSDVNHDILAQLDLQDVERFQYKGADGWPIDGFFVKPVGWSSGRQYPMVLVIHGGPASMYGVGWFHEFQVYAARGWAVLYTNPRGSGGYGEKFQRGVDRNWGGKAYDDIMAGVDEALRRYPWVDSARVGVTGGSYGGFMTNWIVSHTTRFKAAVTLRSISNFTSIEGTRDAAYSHARDFGGDLFQNYQFYWDSSPLKYVKNVKTPTLVLHSDNDQRVPIEQGEQWFRALQHFGVTSEFVIFPRENHNLTRNGEPRHLVESLEWQVYWFDRFLNGNTAAVRPNER